MDSQRFGPAMVSLDKVFDGALSVHAFDPSRRRTLYLCPGDCKRAACQSLAVHAMQLLGITFNQRTADGLIGLRTYRCREEGSATSIMIDEEILPDVTPCVFDAVLAKIVAENQEITNISAGSRSY